MTHALTRFIVEQMDARTWRQREVVTASGLSRQVVSKWANDHRDAIKRVPDKQTLEGFAKAFNVPLSIVLGKAVEALDAGYEAGDVINDVETASDEDLMREVQRRLSRDQREAAQALGRSDETEGTSATA